VLDSAPDSCPFLSRHSINDNMLPPELRKHGGYVPARLNAAYYVDNEVGQHYLLTRAAAR
jgi:hypothetical protein